VAWQPDTPPPALRQIWRWFCQLDRFRPRSRITEPTQDLQGHLAWQVRSYIEPIHPTEIMAWQQLSAVEMEPWQFAALLLIDDFFVRTRNDPPKPQVRANAENIKAMFAMLRKKKK